MGVGMRIRGPAGRCTTVACSPAHTAADSGSRSPSLGVLCGCRILSTQARALVGVEAAGSRWTQKASEGHWVSLGPLWGWLGGQGTMLVTAGWAATGDHAPFTDSGLEVVAVS